MYQVRLSYNMLEGKESECREFLAQSLAPGLASLGFQFTDVLYTLWGNAPQILGAGTVDSVQDAQSIFGSNEWEGLAEEMKLLTEDFKICLIKSDQELTR